MTDIQTRVIGHKTYYKVVDINKKLGMNLDYAIRKIDAEVVKVSDPKYGSVRYIDDDNIDKLILFLASDNYNKPTEATMLTKIIDSVHKGEAFESDNDKESISKNIDNLASDFLKSFVSQQFGLVRVLVDDDKILFCGSDIAKALGYQNPSRDIQRHCKAAQLRCTTDSVGRNQEMLFIHESDVYRLIVHSKLPSAERFEKWLFEEVLPTIRKYGAYTTPDTLDQMIASPEFGIKLLTALKEEQERNKQISEENERLNLVNQGLIHQTMTWKHRSILNALLRSLAHSSFKGDYRYAYNTLYKELLYKKGISLKQRQGDGNILDRIRENEWDDVIEVAIALCESSGINVGNIINETNTKRLVK